MFRKKRKESERYEDPALRYGRLLKKAKDRPKEDKVKPSLLARLFGIGLDSGFVYHED